MGDAVAGVLRDTVVVVLIAAAAGALTAAIVVLSGAQDSLRDWYALTPQRPVQVGVGELWLSNARALLPTFGAAAAVVWWPRARPALDAALVLIFGANVLLVAVALAAYGQPLWDLGPGHYPLELLAVATATAAYLDARRSRALRAGVVGACAALTALVVVLAALLESGGVA